MAETEGRDPWGVTTLELFERLADGLEGDGPRAVATVVDVEGSAYRRPGAKMLFDADGAVHGGITAGCLEEPLREEALAVIEAGEPVVRTYDLTDDGGWGLGLGCEGVVDVLVEPVDGSWARSVEAFRSGEGHHLLTVLDGPEGASVGARGVVTDDGTRHETADRPALPAGVADAVDPASLPGTPHRRRVETGAGPVDLFVDRIEPATRLLVFGGQPDVRSVTRLARAVGMHVTVATARGGRADPSAFPRAHEVVATHPGELADLVDDRTHVVVMSHNYVDDLLALEGLLGTDVPYIGLMGPRERFDRLRDDLAEEGVAVDEGDEARIASPVGLDLGGGAPVEIAFSVVAEVVAASNGREGGRLRDRAGPIHDRVSPQPE